MVAEMYESHSRFPGRVLTKAQSYPKGRFRWAGMGI